MCFLVCLGFGFLFNCVLIESLSLPHWTEEEFGSVDPCSPPAGTEKPGSATGQGTAARARVGSPTPYFLPAWWLLRTVLHFSLLFTLTRPLPAIPTATLQSTPCPSPPVARGLGCCTDSQQAGAVRLGVGKPGWGSQPIQGDVVRADSGRGGCWETEGYPQSPALTCPRAKGWLAARDLLGRGTWCQGGPKSKGDATAPSFSSLPGFPRMLAHDGGGKLWIPGFGASTLRFAARGLAGAFPGRASRRAGVSGRGHGFCCFLGSDRFRCRAGLEETGSTYSILADGHHRGGLAEAAGAQ